MIRNELTTKSQTTVPQPVRLAVGLEPGDAVVYQIEGDPVILRKADPEAVAHPFATFSWWAGEADRKAYGDL